MSPLTMNDKLTKQPIEIMLGEISSNIENIEKVITSAIKFYYVNRRHRYSQLSKFLNIRYERDKTCFDFILLNLDIIENFIIDNRESVDDMIYAVEDGTNKDFNYECFLNNIRKLIDHVELEKLRADALLDRDDYLSKSLLARFNTGINKAQQDLQQSTKDLENKMNNSIVAVLGIFAAIIIAFFGSLNVLGNIFSALGNEKVKTSELIIISCITGIVVFNLIFMLLYSVSKMISKDIGCFISIRKLNELNTETNPFKKICKYVSKISIRFPILIGFNIFILIITIISSLAYK